MTLETSMTEYSGKVIPIKQREVTYCPRCGWGGLLPKEEVYWCDKCTARYTKEEN